MIAEMRTQLSTVFMDSAFTVVRPYGRTTGLMSCYEPVKEQLVRQTTQDLVWTPST